VAEAVRLYAVIALSRVRSQLQYRTSFVLDLIGMFLIAFLDFLAIAIIFQNVPRLGDWSLEEVALLYGMSGIAFAITDMVVGHLDELGLLIRSGDFDVMLVRPMSTLIQVLTLDFQLRRLGKLSQSAVVLAYAISALDIDWNAARVAVLASTIVSAAVIFGAVWVAVICIVFWSVEGNETANAFTYGGQFLAQYPLTIYDAWLRRLLAFVMPMAFVAYLPALYILGKPNELGLPRVLQFASPVVAVLACVVARLVWRFSVRHYRSAGG
jgi:ABC-2 type transport system permease protein